MKIKDLPEMEKPYEKFENYGAERLSDAELLAIIIKSGTKDKTSVELAQEILLLDSEKRGLNFLKEVSIDDLRKIKGLGRVKAIQLKATIELAKRISKPYKILRKTITSPDDVAEVLMSDMKDSSQEMMKVIVLNVKNEIVRVSTISLGTANSTLIEARDVFKEAIRYNSTRIIVAHNHPSGDPTPSKSDIVFSARLRDAGKLIGIEVLDHVIIGNDKFCSLKRMNKF
jgi:DNA repair protein RadC